MTASRPSMTEEMLISEAPWEIISMLMLPSARVLWRNRMSLLADRKNNAETHLNILPAIPTMFFMCLPTSERMHMSRLMET